MSIQDNDAERCKTRGYYLKIIKSCDVIINWKHFHDQPIDSYTKRYKQTIKLTRDQDEDNTTGCLLNCIYIKSHFTLIEVNLSRQKELDADLKAF